MYENLVFKPETYPATMPIDDYLAKILYDDIQLFREKYKELWGTDTQYLALARHRLNALPIDAFLEPDIAHPSCQARTGVILKIRENDHVSFHCSFECKVYKFKVVYDNFRHEIDDDEATKISTEEYIRLFKTAFALDFPPKVKHAEIRLFGLTDEHIKQFGGRPAFSELRKKKYMKDRPENRFETEYQLRSIRMLLSDVMHSPPKVVGVVMNLLSQITKNPSSEQIEKFLADIQGNCTPERRAVWDRVLINYLSYTNRNLLLFYEAHRQGALDTPVAGVIYETTKAGEVVIKSIWVDEEHRGKGYGREIITGLVEDHMGEYFKLGVKVICPEENVPFFKAVGFKHVLRGIIL